MSVEHIKSTPITNAEAVPAVANTTGEGGPGYLREASGSLTVPASSSTDSTLRLVRVPTNAKVKQLRIQSQAQAAGTLDVGVYYPISGKTGKADLAANAIDQDFFASAYAVTSLSQPTDITNESGTYTADKWNQPLWQAVGLSADPGGFFDIVATVVTAVTTGTGILGLSVAYVD